VVFSSLPRRGVKSAVCFRDLENVITVRFKHRVVKKDITHQQGLACTGLFGRLVQQNMIVDGDTQIARKYQVRDRRKDHGIITQRAGDEDLGQLNRVGIYQLQLHAIVTAFYSANGRYQFFADIGLLQYIAQQGLDLNNLCRIMEILIIGLKKIAVIFGLSIAVSLPFILSGSRKYISSLM
jgi:hypothetical protein